MPDVSQLAQFEVRACWEDMAALPSCACQQVGGMGFAPFTEVKQNLGLSESSRAGLVLLGQIVSAACVR